MVGVLGLFGDGFKEVSMLSGLRFSGIQDLGSRVWARATGLGSRTYALQSSERERELGAQGG